MIDNKTGYIKINRFSETTYDEFKTALASLKAQGMTQLMMDLRNNPGGYMDRATNIADEFISGNKLLVYTDGKDNRYDRKTYAHIAGQFEEGAAGGAGRRRQCIGFRNCVGGFAGPRPGPDCGSAVVW